MNAQLKELVEKGEERDGNIEFKKSLCRDIHLQRERQSSLEAQMRHRILSGDGVAVYGIGISDSGELAGISRKRFEETVEVLSEIASNIGAEIKSVERFSVEDGLIGIIEITEVTTSDKRQLLIGTAGHVDHGKSTLVGSLVTGKQDDGELREYLDVNPHEIERGLSADLSYAVYGFKEDGTPIHMDNPDRNGERSSIVANSEKVVSLIDTVGHEPWLRTTIRGIVGQRIDYGLLTVAANEGPTKVTREHLGVLLAMEIPTIVAITKTDLVSEETIQEIKEQIEKLLEDVNCQAIDCSETDINSIVSRIDSSTLPVTETSAVTREGFSELDALLYSLPKKTDNISEQFKMYIDRTYVISGVGTVVSGTIKSGELKEGDTLYMGPDANGEYITTKAKSIEIHYQPVKKAKNGQIVSVALQNVSEEDVRRGMVLSKGEPTATKEFIADVMVLNHPTKISDGYEPVIHLETISESIVVTPDNSPLLPGDTGQIQAKFKFNKYHIEEGQRFVFREGKSKGVGTIKEII